MGRRSCLHITASIGPITCLPENAKKALENRFKKWRLTMKAAITMIVILVLLGISQSACAQFIDSQIRDAGSNIRGDSMYGNRNAEHMRRFYASRHSVSTSYYSAPVPTTVTPSQGSADVADTSSSTRTFSVEPNSSLPPPSANMVTSIATHRPQRRFIFRRRI